MKKMRNKLIQWVMVATFALSIFTVTTVNSEASGNGIMADTASVLTYYEKWSRTDGSGGGTENHVYRTIYFQNGFSYKETWEDISTFGDIFAGVIRTAFTRTYTTY